MAIFGPKMSEFVDFPKRDADIMQNRCFAVPPPRRPLPAKFAQKDETDAPKKPARCNFYSTPSSIDMACDNICFDAH